MNTMINNVKLIFMIVFVGLIFSSCMSIQIGNTETGDIDDVERYFYKEIKDKVTDVELIDTVRIEEWEYDSSVSFDGTVFWPGSAKLIPAHDILYYRAFSPKLDSYIFLRFNDRYDAKQYRLSGNSYAENEKYDVKLMVNGTKEILADNNIKILTLTYSNYLQETEEWENVNKYSKDYYENYPYGKDDIFNNSMLWILVTIDNNMSDIIALEQEIGKVFKETKYYLAQMQITSKDNQRVIIRKSSDGATLEYFNNNYELYNGDKDRWEKFIEFVSERDFMVFLPEWSILEYEYKKYCNLDSDEKLLAFMLNFDDEESIKRFISMIDEFANRQRKRAKEAAAIIDFAKRNIKEANYKESELIPKLLEVDGITINSKRDYVHFPSTRVHGFAIARRILNSKRKPIGTNDIMDSLISYCIPYVDIVITDKEQCEILKQAKREIPELKNLEICPLSSFANMKDKGANMNIR